MNDLETFLWLIPFLIVSLVLLVSGYLGYAGVLLAIALSAAINVR